MDGIESMNVSASPSSLLLQEAEFSALTEKGPAPNEIQDRVGGTDAQKLQLAKDFESILLTRFFDEVRRSIGNCGFEEDPAGQQVHGMFWSYLAQDVADKGGFGLSQDIYQHFQDMDGAETVGALVNKEL